MMKLINKYSIKFNRISKNLLLKLTSDSFIIFYTNNILIPLNSLKNLFHFLIPKNIDLNRTNFIPLFYKTVLL